VKQGDLVMTLGAGDIYYVGEKLLDKLGAKSEEQRAKR
jgi:UDP-N-acetylmuramate-alanine ligase